MVEEARPSLSKGLARALVSQLLGRLEEAHPAWSFDVSVGAVQ
jgi:hypothetical protein